MSVPATLSVGEGDGIVQVCTTLLTPEPIGSSVRLQFVTSENSGIANPYTLWSKLTLGVNF